MGALSGLNNKAGFGAIIGQLKLVAGELTARKATEGRIRCTMGDQIHMARWTSHTRFSAWDNASHDSSGSRFRRAMPDFCWEQSFR